METRKLEHLIELANAGSFSRAAINLHLTQSALSKSIQSLEAELGVQLVERFGRRCAITTAGALLVDRASKLLPEIENLLSDVKGRPDYAGLLRVGFGAGPGACMSADFIAHVLQEYPSVRLLLRRGTGQFLLSELRARALDVVIIDTRSLPASDDLAIEPVGTLEGSIVCRTGHPLTILPKVTFQDVLKYPLLNTAISDEAARRVKEHYGVEVDLRALTSVESEELEPLVEATARTNAIFLGMAAASNALIKAGRLQRIVIDSGLAFAIPISSVRLATRAAPLLTPVVNGFVSEWIRSHDL